jgi:prolyl-tRNA synthetase
MRYTQLLGKTLRDVTHDARLRSHELLIKAGYIRPLAHGLVSFLPLGIRVVRKLSGLIGDEMRTLGGQEVQVPLVNPMEIWERSGRHELAGQDLARFRDRTGRALVLSPTHEEAMVELAREYIRSYRDLPVFVFQFQDKFRDEARPRGGLLRSKEFLMKDAYSFHRSASDLNNFFPKVFASYQRVFKACGIQTIAAESGVGYMGGERAYEFLMPLDQGDDTIVVCDHCNYRANGDVAVGIKEPHTASPQRMATEETGVTAIGELAALLKLPRMRLAKSMVYRTRHGLVMAVVRGDYEVSEEKLTHVLGTPVLRLASAKEIRRAGLVPGYASPVGLEQDIPIVVDDAITGTSNLVFGANAAGKHYVNVNYGRDLESEQVVDIARMCAKDRCVQCGAGFRAVRAVELGNIFKLGDFYARSMELSYQSDAGHEVYPHMGSYGIGIGRLMAAVVEANNDEKGIRWPPHLAPYSAYLMAVGRSMVVRTATEQLYKALGDDVLYDDRDESPGVKFQDADLLGIPFRFLVSARHLSDGKVEVHERGSDATYSVPLHRVVELVSSSGRAIRF